MMSSPSRSSGRRFFAAKRQHLVWGCILVVLGAPMTGIGLLGVLTLQLILVLNPLFVVALGLLLWGIYLLRGPKPLEEAQPQMMFTAPPMPVPGPSPAQSEVRIIVDESNEPVDVRIRKLNNLRFERLITDEEFKAAKNKILGI